MSSLISITTRRLPHNALFLGMQAARSQEVSLGKQDPSSLVFLANHTFHFGINVKITKRNSLELHKMI